MGRYRKKLVEVQAVRFTGDNYPEVRCLLGDIGHWSDTRTYIRLPPYENQMVADVGDWIIRDIKGEFYPCKPDIFEATYEPVELL